MAAGWRAVARRIRVPMGFLFAGFFLWRARPTVPFLAWSLLLVAPGLWLRAYASGYVKKNSALTVAGPYAHTRNPLYLGSMMMAFGFVLASRSISAAVLLAALFAIIYVPTILSEEEFLRSAFPQYNSYAREVPRLFPRLTPARLDGERPLGFSRALYLQHREYNALLGAAALYAALVVCLLLGRP